MKFSVTAIHQTTPYLSQPAQAKQPPGPSQSGGVSSSETICYVSMLNVMPYLLQNVLSPVKP